MHACADDGMAQFHNHHAVHPAGGGEGEGDKAKTGDESSEVILLREAVRVLKAHGAKTFDELKRCAYQLNNYVYI